MYRIARSGHVTVAAAMCLFHFSRKWHIELNGMEMRYDMKKICDNKKNWPIGLSLAVLLSLPLTAEAAPEPSTLNVKGMPDSGRILNELEPERRITPRQAKPEIDTKIPDVQQGSQKLQAHIDRIEYICAELDVKTVLKDEMQLYLGRDMDFAAMQDLAQKVTASLRRHGYMTAVAYVPAQDIANHTLKIKVIIGRIGDLRIDNTSSLIDERLLSYIRDIRPGQLIKSQPLEKTLLTLNDLAGIKVTASMQPGKRRGSADLLLKVFDLEREGSYLSYDNYGSKSTGRNRFGIEYHYNNLTNVGDQISLSGMTSTDDLHNFQLRYTVPVGNDGASLHLTAGQMNYVLGGQYDYLNADGLTNTYELGVSIPMRRTYAQSHFYSVNVRHRDIHDYILSGMYGTEKTSDSIEGDVYGYYRDDRNSFSYTIGHVAGDLHVRRNNYSAPDAIGNYHKSLMDLYYIHEIDRNWQLHVSMSGQYGCTPLDSSEQFYISGADAVRAFVQGEAGGRSGLLGTVEIRRSLGIPGLMATAFVDAGRIMGDGTKDLAGAGLGLIYQKSRDWYGKFDWATPLGCHYSESLGKDVTSTAWLRLVKQF